MSDGEKQHAAAAEQAVRLLVHAMTRSEFDDAPDVDSVLADLAQLGALLPLAVDKLCRGLLRLYNADQVGHDEGLAGADLDAAVDEAADALGAAVQAAGVMAAALDQARQITSHFTGGAR